MGFKTKIDKADKLFGTWIKLRDDWTCQRCFRKYQPPTQALHCTHFKSRRKENTRFEPLNCDAICFGCHQFFHQYPEEHEAWQLAKKGQEVLDELTLASHAYKKKDRASEVLYWTQELSKKTYILPR